MTRHCDSRSLRLPYTQLRSSLMTWIPTIVVWLCIAWFAVQALDSWKSISRSSATASRWLHAFTGIASIAALAVVWERPSWTGIGMSLGLWLGASILEMLAGRLWVIYLLRSNRSRDVDIFMRDP